MTRRREGDMPSQYLHEWIETASFPELLWLFDELSGELDSRGLRDPAARCRDARESIRVARVGELDRQLAEDRKHV
jgi:hypothetical protein